jgi:hypothetical protein
MASRGELLIHAVVNQIVIAHGEDCDKIYHMDASDSRDVRTGETAMKTANLEQVAGSLQTSKEILEQVSIRADQTSRTIESVWKNPGLSETIHIIANARKAAATWTADNDRLHWGETSCPAREYMVYDKYGDGGYVLDLEGEEIVLNTMTEAQALRDTCARRADDNVSEFEVHDITRGVAHYLERYADADGLGYERHTRPLVA